jgi:Zn-finger nucleic acid-binding protein
VSHCPDDGLPLAPDDADGHRYCRCPGCGGFRIPGASIERAIRLGGLKNLREGAAVTTAPVPCPDCGTACGSLVAQGVTIDTCPWTCGVWIDRGEAARLVSTGAPPR